MSKSKLTVKSAKAWAAISEDSPPEIWHVAWYKDQLERQDLKHIRVMVVPEAEYRKLLAADRKRKSTRKP